MNRSDLFFPLLALLASLPAIPAAAQQASPPRVRLSADECAVWARESSFATSVAQHDARAFAQHLHPGTAFGVKGPRATRGSAAVAAQWAGLIEGKTVRLAWYPVLVTIGGVADIAYSSGPALYESLRPGATPRFTLGTFQSVWHRGGDGVWRVLFDDGTTPRPATDAQVAAFRAGRRACPQG